MYPKLFSGRDKNLSTECASFWGLHSSLLFQIHSLSENEKMYSPLKYNQTSNWSTVSLYSGFTMHLNWSKKLLKLLNTSVIYYLFQFITRNQSWLLRIKFVYHRSDTWSQINWWFRSVIATPRCGKPRGMRGSGWREEKGIKLLVVETPFVNCVGNLLEISWNFYVSMSQKHLSHSPKP